jgi:hypothetical protein
MNYLGIIYSLVTKLPIITPLIILAILVQRFVNKDERIIDEVIWFAYSIGIAILYFIAIKAFENHNVMGFLEGFNKLFIKGVNFIYCIVYMLFMLCKNEKKKGFIGAISLTLTPILLNFVEQIFT